MTPDSKQNFRAVSWWIEWPDLELGNPGVYDRIQRRADSFAEAAADTAIVFGAHFRWDFLPYWHIVHAYLHDVSQALKERNIVLFDHHSSTLTHRFKSAEETREGMLKMIHHLPWAPSPEAAAGWTFHGEHLDSWRAIDARTGQAASVPQYFAQQFCINHSGFRAAYREYLKRLTAETGIGGLMCDDMIYFGGFYHCACEHCRRKLSFPLPETSDASFWGNWGDERWLEYLAMRRRSTGEFLESVKESLPEGFPLMSCCTSGAYGGNNHCAQSIHEFVRGDNIINLEICGDNPARVPERLAGGSYQAAASKKYGCPVIAIGYGFFPDSAGHLWALNHMTGYSTWFSTLKGKLGLSRELLAGLPDDAAPIAAAFRFEKDHPELFSEELQYECAVFFSEKTKTDSYFGACETGATKDYRDLIRMLFSAGIRAETIFDFPENTAQCPCVLMPSVVLLSEEETAAMKRYLASGGTILRFGPDSPAFFPARPEKDFESLKWLCGQTFDSYRPADEWHEPKPGLWYDPAREPRDLLTMLRTKMRQDLPKVEADGFAVGIRKNSIHLLALEYDLMIDEQLEAMRRQHSHVRLIREAKPKNCTRTIRCSVPVAKIYCPLGGSGRFHDGEIILEGDPMYVILQLS